MAAPLQGLERWRVTAEGTRPRGGAAAARRGEVEILADFPDVATGPLPLTLIAGLHEEAERDLEKAGIRTIEDLAVANPVVLLTETGYAFRHIVDLVGQGLLLNPFG